jgi:FtsP/CotA-like multicopper oxidase with cupredoxin domain
MTKTSRRTFIAMAGSAALATLTGSGLSAFLSACTSAGAQLEGVPSVSRSNAQDADVDVEIALRATPTEVRILPGQVTRVWSYFAEVLKGDPNAAQDIPESYLGPILRFHTGQKVRIRFTNNLPEPSIVHWHGLHVPEAADGHPRMAIDPGETYTYEFQIANRAGTYWFHPHPHGRTGPQVYNGLAGLLLVTDDEEQSAGLPDGERDIPLVIQDRTFDAENQFVYLPNGMRDRINGFVGDQILVNGQPDYLLSVATRAYRLRVLNGSNSRTYKLAWDDGTPMTVIATDGGLLEEPVQRDYVTLSPGERVELWTDYGQAPVGREVRLMSLPFYGAEAGGMMDGNAKLANGAEFTILRMRVDRKEQETLSLPKRLSTIRWHRVEDAVNRRNPRTFELAMRQMNWLINGRTWEMESVARDEVVRLGDTEIWEFVNQDNGMLMIHPMHIHEVQFQVLEREILPEMQAIYDTVRHGYVDEGWKDTVLLMPGERVKLLVKFEHYAGLYLYHCHNLEHEDLGMMRNYRIKG